MTWSIRDRASFEALRHSSAKARRGPLHVTYSAVGTAPAPRVAYAVGRRVGNAVARNRLRRRLRAAVAGTEGLDRGAYLVSAAPEAASLGFDDLKKELADAMTSASQRAQW